MTNYVCMSLIPEYKRQSSYQTFDGLIETSTMIISSFKQNIQALANKFLKHFLIPKPLPTRSAPINER